MIIKHRVYKLNYIPILHNEITKIISLKLKFKMINETVFNDFVDLIFYC